MHANYRKLIRSAGWHLSLIAAWARLTRNSINNWPGNYIKHNSLRRQQNRTEQNRTLGYAMRAGRWNCGISIITEKCAKKEKQQEQEEKKCEVNGSDKREREREMAAPGVSWQLYTQLTLLKYTLRLKTLNFFMFSGYFFFAELFIRNLAGQSTPRGAIKIAWRSKRKHFNTRNGKEGKKTEVENAENNC